MTTHSGNRIAKNGRLTVSLPEEVVLLLNKIGGQLQIETGVKMSYAQIVTALAHRYNQETK